MSCLGPLGRPVRARRIRPRRRGWLPAASASRHSPTLGERIARARTRRRRSSTERVAGAELFYLDWFESRGIRLVLATEDGSIGDRGASPCPGRELQARIRSDWNRVDSLAGAIES